MHGFSDIYGRRLDAGDLVASASPILAHIEDLHARYGADFSGHLADYIPELAKADPAHFGICLATVDGKLYEAGDSRQQFTIQSISKPFVYGLAMEDRGQDAVLARVGVEPSGEAFNSVVFDERTNRPFNPMVNAGAIATTALIAGDSHGARLDRLLAMFARFTGHPVGIDDQVYLSEKSTGHRNRAIAYLELNAGMIDQPVDEHLDLYFRQCSVLVDARDLACMAATLANSGINPLSGEAAMGPTHVRSILSVMSSAGMYDFSGEWCFRVGLPAKSGVAGGIIAVLPGQFGIGVFSPLLDPRGNSVRGIAVCEALCRFFNLHVYEARRPAGTIVRRELDGATMRSKRQRPSWQQTFLDAQGAGIVIYGLQGDLFFASMERLCRRIFDAGRLEAGRAMRFVILDGHRIGVIDSSARTLLGEIRDALAARGVPLLLAGFLASARAYLCGADSDAVWPSGSFFPATDEALEWCEDRLIAGRSPSGAKADDVLPLAALDVVAGLSEAETAVVGDLVTTVSYEAGEYIVREGAAASELFMLAAGSATVRVRSADQQRHKRVGSIEPGVTFGEFALFEGSRRIADVVADGPVVCYELSVDRLDALATSHPNVHSKLMRNVLRAMAERLRRATDEMRALED